MPGSHEALLDDKKLALVRLALLIKMGSEGLSDNVSELKKSYEGDKLKDSAEETIVLLQGNHDGAPGYIKAAKEVIRETGNNEMIFDVSTNPEMNGWEIQARNAIDTEMEAAGIKLEKLSDEEGKILGERLNALAHLAQHIADNTSSPTFIRDCNQSYNDKYAKVREQLTLLLKRYGKTKTGKLDDVSVETLPNDKMYCQEKFIAVKNALELIERPGGLYSDDTKNALVEMEATVNQKQDKNKPKDFGLESDWRGRPGFANLKDSDAKTIFLQVVEKAIAACKKVVKAVKDVGTPRAAG